MTVAISIVMPYRDAAATIGPVLDDCAAQTLASWELIAVDDASRDDGAALVAARAAVDRRVRAVASPGRGIVAALAEGCRLARAPLIARMDADDRMAPARLERQRDLLQARPELGVASCLVEFGGDPVRAAGFAEHVRWCNTLVAEEEILRRRFVESPLPHPTLCVRRELFDRHGGYREGAFPEDYELLLRWLDAGVRMAKAPETLVRWNDSPGRLTRRDPRYAIERHAALRCAYLLRELERCARGRSIWLWGAGRVTRRRFDGLLAAGVEIAGWVDIDPDRIGQQVAGRRVIAAGEIPPPDEAFVVSCVAARGARELIAAALEAQGRREGADFLLAG